MIDPVRTGYKYIVFRTDSMNPMDWVCLNRRTMQIGRCAWYKPWRCWVFEASNQAVWSDDCLTDIADFLKQLNGMGPPVSHRP